MYPMNAREKKVTFLAWLLSVLVFSIAIFAWGQGVRWQLTGNSIYVLFPLFGLIAFSIMWSHYIALAVSQYFKVDNSVLKDYFKITSGVVLLAILLHPGLLIWKLWRDGAGLPPGSYFSYVESGARWALILSTISWFIFIAFEFHRKFGNRSWWKYVTYLSDLAMLLILLHALRLGTLLISGWLRKVWYFYGITLVGSLTYIYIKRLNTKT